VVEIKPPNPGTCCFPWLLNHLQRRWVLYCNIEASYDSWFLAGGLKLALLGNLGPALLNASSGSVSGGVILRLLILDDLS